MPESTHRQALDGGIKNVGAVARRIAKEIIITGTEEPSNYMAFGKEKLSTTIYQQWQRFYPVGCIYKKMILIISSICHYTTAAF